MGHKIEKLNWEPPIALQCKVNMNSSLALEKYLGTRFEFCDSLIRVSITKKLINDYKYNKGYLVSSLMKAASSKDSTKASNAIYLLMYMSDFITYLEAKEQKKKYIPKNYQDQTIHTFLINLDKENPNCDLSASYYAVQRLTGDLARVSSSK
jgi:hypothetical protein